MAKKKRKASTFPEEIVLCIRNYIHAVHDTGGVINTAIVIGVAPGII